MSQHLFKLCLFSSLSCLVSTRYLDNDHLVLTTQLDEEDQLFSAELEKMEEMAGQEIGYNQLTESGFNFDLMPPLEIDDLQMNQPEVDNNQQSWPEMDDAEETRQEEDRPIIRLKWSDSTKVNSEIFSFESQCLHIVKAFKAYQLSNMSHLSMLS